MKIKIIRKFLAFSIAISTVAAMPGLAGAMPKKSNVSENKVNENEKEKEKEKEKECMETLEKVLNEYDNIVFSEVTHFSGDKDFVDSVEFLSSHHKDIFKNFSQEKMTKILCFLHMISKFDNYFHYQIVKIIQNLSDINFSKEGIIEILDILKVCRDYFDGYGIEDIFLNLRDSYFGPEKEIFSKAADVFLSLVEDPSNIRAVFDLINSLMCANFPFLDYCTPSQISKIIDLFDIFIKKCETIQTCDLQFALELARHPKLKTCSSKSILKFKDIIINLTNDKKFLNSKHINPAAFIAEFVKTGILTNLDKQQTMTIFDELLKFSEGNIEIPINMFGRKLNNNERFNNNSEIFEKPGAYGVYAVYSKSILPCAKGNIVSDVASYFGSHIYINNLKTDSDNARRTATIIKNLIWCPAFDRSELAVIDILSECVKTNKAKDAVLAAIAHMVHNPSFSVDMKTQMTKIIQILNICSKDDDRQLAVSSIIGELAEFDFFKESSEDELLKIIDSLTMCAKNCEANKNVKFSLEKMLLDSNSSPSVALQMLDLLFKCVTEDSDKESIVSIMEYLAFSEKLNNCKPNTMSTLVLVHILNECCDDNKTQAVSKIIEKLANSHIIEYSNDSITLINDILEKCSSNKFAKKNVVNSVEKLLNNSHINSSSHKNNTSNAFLPGNGAEIYRILKILNNCWIDCYGDVALKVVSSANLIKKAYNNVQNSDDSWIVKNLIKLLNNCAHNNIAKKDCVKFINKLIIDGCFSDNYLSITLGLLQKCVEYAPAKEDVLAAVQSLVDFGYINPNNISSHKDQICSLILNCSECGNKEILGMIHKKLFTNDGIC